MPYYSSGRISGEKLRYLLSIYEGKEVIDLDSTVEVDEERNKKLHRKSTGSSHIFINQLRSLLQQLDNTGLKGDAPFPLDIHQNLLKILSENRKYLPSETSEELLYKRIATIVHLDIKPKIFASLSIYPLGVFLAHQIMNLEGSSLMLGAFLLLYKYLHSSPIKETSSELSVLEVTKVKSLELRMKQFCDTKSITQVPILVIKEGYNASYQANTANSVPQIEFGRSLLNILDTEERNAVLAHEIGHINHPKKDHYIFGPLIAGCIFFGALNIPLSREIGCLLAVIIIANKWLKPSEYQADEVARELVGPLAHASAQRTLSLSTTARNQFPTFFSIGKVLDNLAYENGLDDVLSSHPSPLRRL